MPLGVAAIFWLTFIGIAGYKRCVKGQRDRTIVYSHESGLISALLVLIYVLYLYLTRTVFDVFNCTPTTPPDGKLYLTVIFEECGIKGGTQLTLLPFALGGLGAYSIGFPLYLGRLLWSNRELVMEDQLLRAKGVGHDRLSNPNALDFRERYGRTYLPFRPSWIMWVLAILSRKFLIAVTAVIFGGSVNFQMAACLLIMFVAYAAQVQLRPYMSPSDFADVLKANEERAAGGSMLHARLKNTIDAIESRGRKIAAPQKILGNDGKINRNALLKAALTWFFNYNTVEATMSFAAVIVCLAGLMYQADSNVSGTRDSITALLLLTISGAIFYFVSAICVEIWNGFRDSADLAAARAAANKNRGMLGSAARASVNSLKNVKLDSQVNPLFLRADGAANLGSDNDSLVQSILASVEPPPKELWTSFRNEFASINKRLIETAAVAADAKAALQRHQLTISSEPVVATGMKREYVPSMRQSPMTAMSSAGSPRYRSPSKAMSPSDLIGAVGVFNTSASTTAPISSVAPPTSSADDDMSVTISGTNPLHSFAAKSDAADSDPAPATQVSTLPEPPAKTEAPPSDALPASSLTDIADVPKLPHGWASKVSSKSGKTFYYNGFTRQTAWKLEDIPPDTTSAEQ